MNGVDLELRTFSDQTELTSRVRADPDHTRDDPDAPATTPEPSRTYQCILVLAAFLMIFHIIGINSIYGLFQVRNAPSDGGFIPSLILVFPGILHLLRDEHSGGPRPGRPSVARRHSRKRPHLERVDLRQPNDGLL